MPNIQPGDLGLHAELTGIEMLGPEMTIKDSPVVGIAGQNGNGPPSWARLLLGQLSKERAKQ